MTDTNPSGASFAPAADTSAPVASTETPAGNFGSTRGSGLARGKRASSAAAPTANPAKSDYKPTAVEVITPQREYRNPFASQEPESAPVEQPVKVEIAEAPAPAVVEPESHPAPAVSMFSSEPVAEKPEIQILPPAEAVRPSVSWESPSASAAGAKSQPDDFPDAGRHDDRPTFRPDRREGPAGGAQPEAREPRFEGRDPQRDSFRREQRQPRDPREARQPRDPRDARQPRDPREARQPRDPRDERPQYDSRPRREPNGQVEHTVPAAPPASGGFLGWLKSLFGAKKPDVAPAARESASEPFNDGHRPRRRHRGGRGHGGNPQGFRNDRSAQGGPRPEGFKGGEGESGGGDRYGGRGRRHRGGQGRDRGGEPRAEGHQGGGAI
jgi:hypothetical protein